MSFRLLILTASLAVCPLLVSACSEVQQGAGQAFGNAGSAISHTSEKLWEDPVPEDDQSALESGAGKALNNTGDALEQTGKSLEKNKQKIWDTEDHS